ncbi:MAG: hypothetical protein JST89_22155 [Cyanobacteria bacterium SZAS-4]|nr:hypothetical protein [Cyanobacteria bacterium SZAS-4]
MSEHKLGEQVLKDTSVKSASGKQESVVQVARNIWGDGPAAANNDAVKRNQPSDAVATSDKVKTGDAHHERVVEASHRIKLLNNELHKPGGPLANSSLELIGFDKAGRLLLIQRDQQGKVEGQYLVDSDSGKIVGRKGAGAFDKWEKSPDYDRTDNKHSGHGQLDSQTGAYISKDKAGKVHEVVDCHGDKRAYERDAKENLTEIIITPNGRAPEHYKPGAGVAEVQGQLWYKQPHNSGDHTPGSRFNVKEDGSLVQQTSSTESVTFGIDGSIIENQGTARETVRRKGFVSTAAPDKKLISGEPSAKEQFA